MHQLSEYTLQRLSDFIADQTGLFFAPERWPDLDRGITCAAAEFGFPGVEACIQWLLSHPLKNSQLEILSSHLTVGETYFFRDLKTFQILVENLLPELLRSRHRSWKSLRIWSAGCCTGEEAYSLSILLHKMMPDIEEWRVDILATDINSRFLVKAQHGLYTAWSFRDGPEWIRQTYFQRRSDGCYEILPSIKSKVTFSSLNLAEDCYPSLVTRTNAIDIIFCRNVLMYFAPKRAKEVIGRLYRCLIDGGWLVVGSAETSQELFSQFETVNFPGVTVYRKQTGKSRELTVVPATIYAPATLTHEGPKNEHLHEQAVKTDRNLLHEQSQSVKRLARSLANQGRIREALECCQRALEDDKLDATMHYLQGLILQELGALSQAMDSLKRAVYLDQKFILAYFNLGLLAAQVGKHQESQKFFRNALLLLQSCRGDYILPESEGISAAALKEIIESRNSSNLP